MEEIFGWMKIIGGLSRTRFKKRKRAQLQAWFVAGAYNFVRMAKLMSDEAAVCT